MHRKSIEEAQNSQEKQGHLILRDHLAAHRTELANDRTFLAAVRTALACLAVGVSFIKFFGISVIEILGWIFILISIGTFIRGFMSYNRVKRVIREEEKKPPRNSDI
jgi:putative membrane protein